SANTNYDARLESLINFNGEEETLIVFRLRIVGRERLVNGTVTILVDMDSKYVGAFGIYSFKNGDWVPSHIKLRREPCDLFTNFIHKYLFPPNADTNIPSGEGNCMKKGEYYIRRLPLTVENWPTFLSRGLNRVFFDFMFEGKSIGGFNATLSIYDSST
ncbi:hypothetical protein KR038_001315, partial [Drosophila bunnanda]